VDYRYGTLAYDAQTANYAASKVLTGGTSGAKAWILSDVDAGTTGTLTLMMVNGGTGKATFADNEIITDSATGSATANGTFTPAADTSFFVAGGKNVSGALANTHKELHSDNTITAGDNLPANRQHGAMAFDGTDLYFVCGHDGSNYKAEIYKADASDEANVPSMGTGWALWHTLTENAGPDWSNGLQRHTAHVWHDETGGNSYLVIVGGRMPDPEGYIDEILLVNLSSKVESILGVTLPAKRGYHTSWLVNDRDELYVAGGFDGSNTVRTVYRIDLQTPAAATATVLGASADDNRRRQAVAIDWLNMTAYLCSGEQDASGLDERSDIWAYDFSTSGSETFTKIAYELSGDFDDHGVFVTIEPPKLLNPGAWIFVPEYGESDEQVLFIVAGEDEGGTFRDNVYSMNLVDQILEIRDTDNSHGGYLKLSGRSTGLSPGDKFAFVGMIRNSHAKTDKAKRPYARLRMLTSNTGDWPAYERILRSPYFVPDTDDWHTFVYHFELQSSTSPLVAKDENEIAAYIMLYNSETQIDIRSAQLIQTNHASTIVPEGSIKYDNLAGGSFAAEETATQSPSGATGKIAYVDVLTTTTGILRLYNVTGTWANNEGFNNGSGVSADADGVLYTKVADALTDVFTLPIDTANSGFQYIEGVVSPHFGSQMNVTAQTIITFTCDATKNLTALSLSYTATEDFNTDEQVTATLYAQPPTGFFTLSWTISTVSGSANFFSLIELNHLRTSRFLLRDRFHWKVANEGGDMVFYGWIEGQNYIKRFGTSVSGKVSGYTITGSNVTYSESKYVDSTPQALSWQRPETHKTAWRLPS